MSQLTSLQPTLLWKYFDAILKIPRPSKKEEKIIAYLENFALENNLDYKKDAIGNMLIKKAATKGKERVKTVVLQSHVDMVCEKNSNVRHNFDTDPIKPLIEGDWVKASGTTLGADNGIGVATSLAVLANKSLVHGPIECLFTVDEETGLTGAHKLEKDFFSGKILINLDSEDEGEIFIGCAGGIDTLISFPLKYTKPPKKWSTYQVSIRGLKGGHSGDDINKGLANANKLLTRLLWTARKDFGLLLSDFQGGNLRNAIPREANALVTLDALNAKSFEKYVARFEKMVRNEFSYTEPDLSVKLEAHKPLKKVLKNKVSSQLLNALYACPNGVMAMSQTVPGLVETSTNLASVHFKEPDIAEIVTSQRSSVESAKLDTMNRVISTFSLTEATVSHSDSYPGWTPNPNSDVLRLAQNVYQTLFSKQAKVKAIHAGLECGLFLEKYPDLDMISIGPTMRGVHSPDERLHIASVEKFWAFFLKILEEIPEE